MLHKHTKINAYKNKSNIPTENLIKFPNPGYISINKDLIILGNCVTEKKIFFF